MPLGRHDPLVTAQRAEHGLLHAGDELVDVMNSRGQGVLNLSLDIGAVKTDLDAHPDVTPGSSVQHVDPARQRVAL